MARVKATFWSLEGKFARVKEEEFDTETEALTAARQYAEPQGYTKIKFAVSEEEFDGSQRITGTTPGGRAGRNIATVDQLYTDGDYV